MTVRPALRRTTARIAGVVSATVIAASLTVPMAAPAAAAGPCDPPITNPVACENSKPGSPASEWDIVGDGAASIQGYATDISVNRGQSINFKVKTDAKAYSIDIYRTGYYNGLGARKIATIAPSASLPQNQPNCLTDTTTGLVDCGNWAVSATWNVPADAVSGVYIAKLTRTDTGDASHIIFVVRDDASTSAIVVQTSDTTWQAYNSYGGASLYGGGTSAGRAYKVSYNRPFANRGSITARDFYFASEFALVQFLEANGYDVSYISGLDPERQPALLLNHRTFVSSGHDEYWSGPQRTAVEAARDAGVNLAFFSGNEVYWRTRWEPSIAAGAASYRTLVCYKETKADAKIDPSSEWTGTWRDPRFATATNGGNRPENQLTGTMFSSNTGEFAIEVPAADGLMRLWRNTSVATQAPGGVATLAANTLGYEFDEDYDNARRPAGLIRMSSTTKSVAEYLVDYGSRVLPGPATHSLTLYRAPSGALVFGAGTIQWSYGLGMPHDGALSAVSVPMQQATINLFADMDAQPATLMAGLVAATKSTDTTGPTVTITSPTAGSTATGPVVTITGTATDSGGGRVGGVEVSVDGGTTWHPATGRESWSYAYTPGGAGSRSVLARATDDSANIGPVSGATAFASACPCTIFPAPKPAVVSVYDGVASSGIELGVKFTPSSGGYVTGVRFYKGPGNTGTHVGRLWSPSGALLASATFVNESATGWQSVTFAAPVAVVAGQTYTASYSAPVGNYSTTSGFFSSGAYAGTPLSASAGVYRYGSGGVYPTATYGGENYAVDVTFSATLPQDTFPPTVMTQSPAPSATDVSPSTTVSASFDEDIVAGYAVTVTPQGGSAVAGATAWNATNRTLTFTPTSALATSTTYTVTFAGIADALGNTSAPITWTFTTASTTVPVTTIFGSSLPAVASASDTASVELGTRFTTSVSGFVTGVRFYKGTSNTGTHTGRLWDSNGTLLASVTFTGESASGWQTATFSAAVPVTPGVTYVVSYLAPAGGYAVTSNFFSSPFTSGALTATQGVYRYGSGGVLPTSSYNNSNYFVDVRFQEGTPTDVTAPAMVSQSPASGATAVPVSTAVSVTYDEAIVTGYAVTVTPQGGAPLAGTTAWNATTKTLTFTPAAALAASTTYAVSVTGIADAAGNTAAPLAWSFTTAAPPDTTAPAVVSRNPAVDATGVGLSPAISATFDEAIATGYALTVTGPGSTAVAGTTAWNATTKTLAFTPTSALTTGTTYAVSITGVQDAAGNASGPITWSFTTADQITIFGAATPAVESAADTASVEVGTRFTAAASGSVTALRFYKGAGNTGTHVGTLWDSAGTAIATVTFTGETASGWQTATLPTPVAITAGQTYVVSYLAPAGGYAVTNNFFSVPYVNGSLSATAGLYRYGTGGVVPAQTAGSNYWVDVVFTNTPAPPADTTAPAVVSRTPAVSATGVSVNSAVSVTFDEAIVSGYAVSVTPQGGSAVAGATAWNATTKTLTFTPTAALAFSTTYAVSVTGVADAAGNSAAPLAWSFTTAATPDTTAPSVVSRAPAVSATGVPVNSTVSVTFDEAIVPGYAVSVTPQGGSAVAGATAWNATTTTLTFTPTAALASSTTYAVSVTGVADAAGNAAAPVAWSFTTAAPADTTAPAVVSRIPAAGATVVNVGSTVSATFDEAIVSGYAVTVTPQGGSAVAGATAWNATTKTLTFTPTAALSPSTTYAVSITGIADAAGNAAAPVSWSFSTDEATIFAGATPAVAASTDTASTEVGTRFTVSANGYLTGIRFYKGAGNTGTHVGRLYTSAGWIVASVTFANETASGWQEARFPAPVPVQTGTTYVVSYLAPVGRYSTTANYFSTNKVSPPFTATRGVIRAGTGGVLPSTASTTNYWVDATYVATQPTTQTLFGQLLPVTEASTDTRSVEVGTRFTASAAMQVTGIRFYKGTGNTGTHVGRLWSSTGTLLATVTFTNETSTGWQTAALSAPVALTAGSTYVVTYYAPVGRVATTGSFFGTWTSGSLSANQGLRRYGTGGVFPTTSTTSNFFVDVVATKS